MGRFMGRYVRPTSLSEALDALATHDLTILAGGTDFYPARLGMPLDDDVLDISALDTLRGIEDRGDHLRIGAITTWTDVVNAELPPYFNGLKAAAREVGGWQVQNVATIAGNLCNASPAADGVPALLSLDARVELTRKGATDTLLLADFIEGNRRVRRDGDQLLTAILVPRPGGRAVGEFLKLGARRYLVISIVMVAGVLELDADGRVATARIAVGACSPVARRVAALEAALTGARCDGDLAGLVAPAQFALLDPIDDCRGTAAYRRDAAITLTRRLVARLGAMA